LFLKFPGCVWKISPTEIHKNSKKTNRFGHLKFKTKTRNCNTDDTKILFNQCLLHLTSLRGVGENMNEKQHSNHNTCAHNAINDYPMEPP